jgi:hypothetical protein
LSDKPDKGWRKDLLSEPLGGHHEEALLSGVARPRVFDLVSNGFALVIYMHGGDDHGMIGDTVTGLQPLSLVHVELEAECFLQVQVWSDSVRAVRGETYLILVSLGIEDSLVPDERGSNVTTYNRCTKH